MRRGLLAMASLIGTFGLLSCSSPTKPSVQPPPPPVTPDPPKITCPAAVSVQSSDGLPAPVTYGSAISTLGSAPVTVACAPSSGSTFPIGASTVTCTATDALQRIDSCSVGITVVAPPRISATRFLAFGDSMTAGELPDPTNVRALVVRDDKSYPTYLRTSLVGRYGSQSIQVTNAGQSGESLAGELNATARSRFSQRLSTGQFDVALVMEGANDLVDRDFNDIPPAIDVLRSMVRDAKSRGIRPFVATLPPQSPGGFRALAWSLVDPYNQQLKSMAASEGVTVVEVYDGFAGDLSLISSDGLHPNVAGYQRIGDVFFRALMQALESPASLNFKLAPAEFYLRILKAPRADSHGRP